MMGMRHVLVHDDFDVDGAMVLDTVRVYLPSLAHELKRVLDEDCGEAYAQSGVLSG